MSHVVRIKCGENATVQAAAAMRKRRLTRTDVPSPVKVKEEFQVRSKPFDRSAQVKRREEREGNRDVIQLNQYTGPSASRYTGESVPAVSVVVQLSRLPESMVCDTSMVYASGRDISGTPS